MYADSDVIMFYWDLFFSQGYVFNLLIDYLLAANYVSYRVRNSLLIIKYLVVVHNFRPAPFFQSTMEDFPANFKLVHVDKVDGAEFEEETEYGVSITRSVQIIFRVKEGLPGNESLYLHKQLPNNRPFLDNEDDVQLWKFIELTLTRLHRIRKLTVPMCVDMLDLTVQSFLEHHKEGLQIALGDEDDFDNVKELITDANHCANMVLSEFQDHHDLEQLSD